MRSYPAGSLNVGSKYPQDGSIIYHNSSGSSLDSASPHAAEKIGTELTYSASNNLSYVVLILLNVACCRHLNDNGAEMFCKNKFHRLNRRLSQSHTEFILQRVISFEKTLVLLLFSICLAATESVNGESAAWQK